MLLKCKVMYKTESRWGLASFPGSYSFCVEEVSLAMWVAPTWILALYLLSSARASLRTRLGGSITSHLDSPSKQVD